MKNNSLWLKIGLMFLAMIVSAGVLWGTFTTRIEDTERRVLAIEQREYERDERLLQIQVQLARIEERLIAIQTKLN